MNPIDENDFILVSDHLENCIVELNAQELNPAKLFSLTISMIEYMDMIYSHFTGEQKKHLLIEAFKDICINQRHIKIKEELKQDLLLFIENDLETVIDSIIQVSNGEFQINEKQQALLIRCIIKLCKCFVKNHNKKMKKEKIVSRP